MGSCFCLPHIRSGPKYNLYRHIEANGGIAISEIRQFDDRASGFVAISQILIWKEEGLLELSKAESRFRLTPP